MDETQCAIAGAEAARGRLISDIDELTDDDARRPSRLPDWSLGHLLTHIARNAEALQRMVDAAARGEVGEMYPGGREQRNADIESGASRGAAVLADDVSTSAAMLEASWRALGEAGWSGTGSTVFGPVAVREIPWRRWREMAVHHVDLGLAYTWQDWPDDYVRGEVKRMTMQWASRRPMGLTSLPSEAMAVSDHHRAAWLLGRATIDGLDHPGLI